MLLPYLNAAVTSLKHAVYAELSIQVARNKTTPAYGDPVLLWTNAPLFKTPIVYR